MHRKTVIRTGLSIAAALPVVALATIGRPQRSDAQAQFVRQANLVSTVRAATEHYRVAAVATGDGYALFHGCVSGQQEGAMGIHLAKGSLVGDGEIDAEHPEALLYEVQDGRHELTGVEYVVLAADWDAKHQTPPVLMGQLFNYVSAPNRYGLPAFYELHVWAWKHNPRGMFADWNPNVSCDNLSVDSLLQKFQPDHDMTHHGGAHP